jgi:excisionase family DNA binding protein
MPKIIENRYIGSFAAMGIFRQSGGGMETYLTIPELADYIKLSEQTVRWYVLNKTVPYHKIHKAVRFRVSEIEQWIDGGGLNGVVVIGQGDDRNGGLFDFLDAGESGERETGAEIAAYSKTENAVETGENTGGVV